MPHQTQGILEALAEHRRELKRFGVRRIGLFGSGLRGAARPRSDLDFVVKLRPKSFDAYMDLKFFLEDLFQRDVDLILLDAIKARLKPAILAETVHVEGFEGPS